MATDRSACEERGEESDNLADPDALAQDNVEDLEAALEQFRESAADSGREEVEAEKNRSPKDIERAVSSLP